MVAQLAGLRLLPRDQSQYIENVRVSKIQRRAAARGLDNFFHAFEFVQAEEEALVGEGAFDRPKPILQRQQRFGFQIFGRGQDEVDPRT